MKSNKKNLYLLAGAIFLITLAVYFPALQNNFVSRDDELYVTGNPYIRSLNASFFKWAFLHFYAANWHPLTWISHALDYAVWGLNPLGHHLTNNILHAVNTFLVVIVVAKLLEASGKVSAPKEQPFPDDRMILATGGVVGLLFGLHPLHVESVAWVAERKDLLCALFYILSVMVYTGYAGKRSAFSSAEGGGGYRLYLLCLVFFILALMSKPMAVSLPFVLLILDWYPFRRIRSGTFWTVLAEKVPFFVLSLIASVITVLAQRSGGAIISIENVPLFTRVLVAARALIAYLWKMVVPLNLMPYYPYPREVSLLSTEYLSAIALVAAITSICAILAKKQKLWLSVWGYYVVTLLPVLGIIQVGSQSMADRYTYLPSIGPFLAVGLGVAHASEKMRKGRWWNAGAMSIVVAAALLVSGSMTYLTIRQIAVWKDSLTLWNSVVEKESDKSAYAYLHRGIAFDRKGQMGRALEDIDTAIALNPNDYEAYISQGIVYYEIGFRDKAIESLNKSIALKPNSLAYCNRALLRVFSGQDDLALADFNSSIKLNKDFAMAYWGRGNLYLKKSEKELAIADYQKACSLGDEEGCKAMQSMGF